MNCPIHQIFDKGLRVATRQAWMHTYIDELLKIVEGGRVFLDDVISHRLRLDEAPHAYKIFNQKSDDCVKVVLKIAA